MEQDPNDSDDSAASLLYNDEELNGHRYDSIKKWTDSVAMFRDTNNQQKVSMNQSCPAKFKTSGDNVHTALASVQTLSKSIGSNPFIDAGAVQPLKLPAGTIKQSSLKVSNIVPEIGSSSSNGIYTSVFNVHTVSNVMPSVQTLNNYQPSLFELSTLSTIPSIEAHSN